jgi:hypothetical protein
MSLGTFYESLRQLSQHSCVNLFPNAGLATLADQKHNACRRYAAECLELATATDNPQVRVALAHMAQDWLRLADQKLDASNTSKATE